MDIAGFRDSGLLELYLMGACTPEEERQVEEALDKWPELQDDIKSISKSLEGVARAQGKKPRAGLKEKIMESARASTSSAPPPTSKGGPLSSWMLPLLGLTTLFLGGLAFFMNNQLNEAINNLEQERINCDSLQNASQVYYAMYDDLQRTDNQQIALAATDKYPDALITLISNSTTQKNYLQLQRLPEITADQSYQLWSLKPNQAPIPLTVFEGGEEVFIPVDYEEGTPTYAITIEPRGGQASPTLENLIGTWGV